MRLSLSIVQQEAALAQRKADSTKGSGVGSRRRITNGSRADLVDGGISFINRLTAAVDNIGHRPARSGATAPAGPRRLAADKQGGQCCRRRQQSLPAVLEGCARTSLAEQQLASANAVLDGPRYVPTVIEMKRAMWDLRFISCIATNPELVAEVKLKAEGTWPSWS